MIELINDLIDTMDRAKAAITVNVNDGSGYMAILKHYRTCIEAMLILVALQNKGVDTACKFMERDGPDISENEIVKELRKQHLTLIDLKELMEVAYNLAEKLGNEMSPAQLAAELALYHGRNLGSN